MTTAPIFQATAPVAARRVDGPTLPYLLPPLEVGRVRQAWTRLVDTVTEPRAVVLPIAGHIGAGVGLVTFTLIAVSAAAGWL